MEFPPWERIYSKNSNTAEDNVLLSGLKEDYKKLQGVILERNDKSAFGEKSFCMEKFIFSTFDSYYYKREKWPRNCCSLSSLLRGTSILKDVCVPYVYFNPFLSVLRFWWNLVRTHFLKMDVYNILFWGRFCAESLGESVICSMCILIGVLREIEKMLYIKVFLRKIITVILLFQSTQYIVNYDMGGKS